MAMGKIMAKRLKQADYFNTSECFSGCADGVEYADKFTISKSLQEQDRSKRKGNAIFLGIVALLLTFITVILTLNTYVFFNVRVEGLSMRPTLYNNELLIANRTRKAQVKDIVIIKDAKPNSNMLLIKRVIANTEGDHIEFMQGKVVLNGEVLDEPYAIGNTYDYNNMGTIVLGKNEVFYLGDNRENSYDSRQYGVCTNEQILGVVENWSISINNFFRAFR